MTNEPTVATENATNEPTDAHENVTNEPTAARENVTNEPTAAGENVTNEPTAVQRKCDERTHRGSENATNEPTDACENVTNEPTEARENATNEPKLAADGENGQSVELSTVRMIGTTRASRRSMPKRRVVRARRREAEGEASGELAETE